MPKPRLLLINPPGSYVDMPGLAIPCLSAYVKQHGFDDVTVWDANLDYIHHLLDPDMLKAQEAFLRTQPGEHGLQLLALPHVRNAIAEAPQIFRDPERYYDVASFERAVGLVQTAMSVYAIGDDPVRPRFDSDGFYLSPDPAKLPFSAANLVSYVKSRAGRSLLRDFVESKLPGLGSPEAFDLIGFTVANPDQFLPVLIVSAEMKRRGWEGRIVVGGSFISVSRRVLKNSFELFDIVDALSLFEGEEPLLGLLQALERNVSIDSVSNLIFREGWTIQETPLRKLADLNALPTPDFSGLPLHDYWTPEPVLPAYSTRGCYYDVCEFCNHHENYFGNFRVRSTDRVIEDLRVFKDRYGTT